VLWDLAGSLASLIHQLHLQRDRSVALVVFDAGLSGASPTGCSTGPGPAGRRAAG